MTYITIRLTTAQRDALSEVAFAVCLGPEGEGDYMGSHALLDRADDALFSTAKPAKHAILLDRISALEADAVTVREKALREAEKIALNVATLEAGMERRDGYMAASDIEHRIEMLRTTAAQPQPEPETGFRRIGKDVVVDFETKQLVAYDPSVHGDLPDENLYDVPTGFKLVSLEPEAEITKIDREPYARPFRMTSAEIDIQAWLDDDKD